MGLDLCKKLDAEGKPVDILLATDPDCDRVGVAVHTKEGYERLSGNQIGVLLFDYLIERKKESGDLPENPLMVTTIVSTPLTGVMAEANGIEVNRVLTGFKYIGEIINKLEAKGEEHRFLMGFEESCGYLTGLHARDKDGVNAAMLIAEMAGLYKKQGKTLTDRLEEIYSRYGCYLESLAEFTKPGASGMQEIAAAMEKFRNPRIKDGFAAEVTDYKDYSKGLGDLPPADVVAFIFAGGNSAILRPSGTEPKLKVYFASAGSTLAEAEQAMAQVKKDILDALQA
jgi:phosphoglucomutase